MKRTILIIAAVVVALALGITAWALNANKDKVIEEPTTEVTTTTAEPTTTTEEPTTKEITYRDLYRAQLDSLLDEYGGDLNGGKLVDLDADGTPELIVFHGSPPSITTEIFTVQNGKVEGLCEYTLTGLRYGQTDVSYQVWINESINPSTLVLFNSEDEWEDEEIYAITVIDGAASTQILKASTDGENSDPDRSWLENFTINDGDVSDSEYSDAYDRLQTGAQIIDPTDADLEGLKSELGD